MKYTSKLHVQIYIELSIFEIYDILITNNLVMIIKRKNQNYIQKNTKGQ